MVIFSLLFRKTCRDPEDFKKHHPPLEMSFCCAAVLENFHQRQNSKAAISYCALSPPATINISPSHRRFSLCPFSVLPFFLFMRISEVTAKVTVGVYDLEYIIGGNTCNFLKAERCCKPLSTPHAPHPPRSPPRDFPPKPVAIPVIRSRCSCPAAHPWTWLHPVSGKLKKQKAKLC